MKNYNLMLYYPIKKIFKQTYLELHEIIKF